MFEQFLSKLKELDSVERVLMSLSILDSEADLGNDEIVKKILKEINIILHQNDKLKTLQITIPLKYIFNLLKKIDKNYWNEVLQYITKIDYKFEDVSPFVNLTSSEAHLLTKFSEKIGEENIRCRLIISVASDLATQGKYANALRIIQNMENILYRVNALCVVATIMKKNGEIDKANDIRQSIKYEINKINEDFDRDLVLSRISVEFAKNGELKIAFDYLNLIKSVHLKSNTMIEISNVLDLQGDSENAGKILYEALEYENKINFCSVWRGNLNKILTELAVQGKLDEALEIAGKQDNEELLVGISVGLAKKGKIAEALITANKISEKSLLAVTVNKIAANLGENGNIKNAMELWERAQEFSEKIKIRANREITKELVSIQLFRNGMINKGNEVLNNIKDERIKIDAVKQIIFELVKQGKINIAREIANDHFLEFEKIIVENEFVAEVIKHILPEEALKIIDKVNNKSERNMLLEELAVKLIHEGQYDDSLKVISKIEEKLRVDVLLKIFYRLAEAGKNSEADKIIIEAFT